jgi:hypothetical protein
LDKNEKEEKLKEKLKNANIPLNSLWWGDIQYENIDKMSLNPGVPGKKLYIYIFSN